MQFVILAALVVLVMGGMAGAYKMGERDASNEWALKQVMATNAANKRIATVMEIHAGRKSKDAALQETVDAELKRLISEMGEPEVVTCEKPLEPGEVLGPERVVEIPGETQTKTETRVRYVRGGCDYPAAIRQKLNSLQIGK